MKNLKTISIIILLLFSVLLMLFAYAQKKESDHSHRENLKAHLLLDSMRIQLIHCQESR